MAAEKKAKAPSRSRRRDRPSPRERLLASATSLFTTEGIRVIGIDRILREADVAKASLYSLFGSKDALVVAYIKQLDQQWRTAWAARAEAANNPTDKLLAFFDLCIEEEPAKGFRGSHFQNAASEYPRPETDCERDIVAAVQEHRHWCRSTISSLLAEKNGYPGGSQAEQLLLYIDGGLAGAKLSKDLAPLYMARQLAADLLTMPPADYAI